MSSENEEYDASMIVVLEPHEAIRKRPGMYVGSTGERGIHQMLFEVADRALNDGRSGRADRVEITLLADGGVRVADDGTGAPVEELDAQLIRMSPVCRPAGGRRLVLSSWGLGLFITSALSHRMTAEVRGAGVEWRRAYARGVPVGPPVTTEPAPGSGTTLTFWPDPEIFGTAECSFDDLADRFRELAFLDPDLDIILTDERGPAAPRALRFRCPGGVGEFVDFLDADAGVPVHPDIIRVEREDRGMGGRVSVALRWCGGTAERVLTFANGRPTFGGGTHAAGFRAGVAAALTAYAREGGLLAEVDADLDHDRAAVGLTAVVSVALDDPEFLGATADTLGGQAVHLAVEEAVRECLTHWLRRHPDRAAAVLARITGPAHLA